MRDPGGASARRLVSPGGLDQLRIRTTPLYMAVALLASVVLAWLLRDTAPSFQWENNDFANYWIGAHLLRDGQVADLFADQAVYFAHMIEAFGPDYPIHNWSYPPHYLFFVFWLGWIGYLPGLVLFLGLTLCAYLWAVGHANQGLDPRALVLLVPFVGINVLSGQNGFLTGALLVGALATRASHPVLAGVLAGCLTIKPQLGVLIPLLWLFERRWKAIASAGITTVTLMAGSAALFGVDAWRGFFTQTIAYQAFVMESWTGIFISMMPTVFGSLRAVEIDPTLALWVHLVTAVAALAVVVIAYRRIRDPQRLSDVTMITTPVVLPYFFVYDMGGIASAARSIAREHSLLATCLAVLPPVTIALGLVGLPIAPVVLWWALLVLVYWPGSAPEPRRGGRTSVEPPEPTV